MDEVRLLIPKLNAEELEQARKLIAVSGGLSVDKAEVDASDWLLSGMVTFLIKEGHLDKGGHFAVVKKKAYKTYLKKLPPVMEYFTQLEKQAKTVTRHRPKLAFIAGRALASLLEGRGVFSVSAMLSQIDKMPEAVEAAFPSYGTAGLFRFVLDNMEDV